MIGLREIYHLYTVRPWIRKQVIGVRVMREKTIFWCNTLEELNSLQKFLEGKGLETSRIEKDSRCTRMKMFSPIDNIEEMVKGGLGCTTGVPIDLEILEELREENYLAINLTSGHWIIK